MFSSDPSISHSLAEAAQLGEVLQVHRTRLVAMLERRMDPRMAKRMDAEDLLSEVYLLARRRWGDRQDKTADNAYPWLYRLALDCLINAWRHEVRECRDPREEMPWPDQSSLQIGFGLVNTGTSPSEALQRDELRHLMQQALAELPPADREVLRMRHEDGLTHAEAAEVCGITVNAVTVRYVRALKRLQRYWSDRWKSDE
jgi:RNA polymerase sigma-70 factor, ECF subfamily